MLILAKSCEEDNTIRKLSITMEDYSAIKKNKMLPFATTQMDLEGILLSKTSQAEKDKYCMLSLICGI